MRHGLNVLILALAMTWAKNGFFYVLDRITGELICATPVVRVNWAKGVDRKTGRPIVDPAAMYLKEPSHVLPSANGGHGWPGMAFDPSRKLAFIPARENRLPPTR